MNGNWGCEEFGLSAEFFFFYFWNGKLEQVQLQNLEGHWQEDQIQVFRGLSESDSKSD